MHFPSLGDSDMLFGTCNCISSASSISRRGLLCAGGAGFVTALISTLTGSSRTARAQALASKPPEVDSLAVRIITDNQIIKFIPTEKRDGLTILPLSLIGEPGVMRLAPSPWLRGAT
jgi:7,8-dihydropterin-6-yl-methyl-4-(beta-D-ribofuranosyl)aminobenzene 5'-phosphate synthase